ncbi:alpha/beta fold hydrolase [Cryobacterium sp. N22]|uniref:alpha/beta fold hydrolase n=1 Tax=Cryobacterium sp. N22 TaxID=2048290 RepID=UPI000CE2F443|nr:alpha/beta hydrolase [Cryobacterium sp. N22]
MAHDESHDIPFAVPGAPAPTVGRYDVNGCRLYAEVRGTGPSLLIIGAASDDAEMFRPIAERLAGFTVVTWDPRGTGRSSREGWPCDSHAHADDAAALLNGLGLAPAAIFGASAGGIVAVRLAVRHPDLVRRVLVYEPGFFRTTDAGTALLASVTLAVREHLRDHPDDWLGALAVVARAAARDQAADRDGSNDDGGRGPLDAPPGLEWYIERGAALAENFIRDDLPRTEESVDGAALRATQADLHFASGSDSPQVFREIAKALTALRRRPGTADPREPDRVAGASHLAYLTPDPIAHYIRARCLPVRPVD